MKFVIALLFVCVLVPSHLIGQHKSTYIPNSTEYTPWQLSNAGGYGVPSFYWKTIKTQDAGAYRFDLYFYSNSFYANGDWASTYVWGMMFYVDGVLLRNEPAWVLFKDTYTNSLFSFYTKNPYPKIFITWEGLKIY